MDAHLQRRTSSRFIYTNSSRRKESRPTLVNFPVGRMLGLDLTSGSLQNVLFKDCRAEYACFRFIKCKAVRFENCSLREANFQGSDLQGCSFRGCDMRQAEMSQARLEGADLRDSKIEGIRVDPGSLSNVTVDFSQAAYLSTLLGLVVK